MVAFVTHGGTFGVQESLYHGVPLVVIPIFLDQLDNAKLVQERQHGLMIAERKTFSAEELEDKIKTVINDPGYKD